MAKQHITDLSIDQHMVMTDGMQLALIKSEPYPRLTIISVDPKTKHAQIMLRPDADTYITTDVYQDGLTIGRVKNDGPHHIIQNGRVSRLHGQLSWADGKLIYRHNSINMAEVQSDDIPEFHEPGANATMALKSGIKPSDDVFTLTDGALLKLHPHLLPYRIHITQDGLRLVEEGSPHNTRQPAQITIAASANKDTTIGRQGQDITLGHVDISALHGMIGYDASTKSFVYSQQGDYPAQIIPAQSFFELHEGLRKKVHDLPIEEATTRWKNTKHILQELQQNYGPLLNVLRLEGATIICKPEDLNKGAKTEDSQKGYALWLRAAELLYRDEIAPEQREHLLRMAGAIEEIGKDRELLRSIEYSNDPQSADAKTKLQQFAQTKVDALNKNGEVYIISGFKAHHEVARLRQKNGTYYLTIYNAGAGATPDPADPQKVFGTYECAVKPGTDLKGLITAIARKKMHSPGYGMDDYSKAIKDAMIKPPVHTHSVYPQNKGNCTTRSTREMIRDVLSEGTFAMIHQHIHDGDIADAQAITNTVEALKTELDKRIDNEQLRPANRTLQPSGPFAERPRGSVRPAGPGG